MTSHITHTLEPLDLIVIAPLAKPNAGIDFHEQMVRADRQVKLAEAAPKLLHALQIARRHLDCIVMYGVPTTHCAAAAELCKRAIVEAGGAF